MSDAQKTIEAPDWIEGIDPRMEVMSLKPLMLSTPVCSSPLVHCCRFAADRPR
jgi:hypothetical protein